MQNIELNRSTATFRENENQKIVAMSNKVDTTSLYVKNEIIISHDSRFLLKNNDNNAYEIRTATVIR